MSFYTEVIFPRICNLALGSAHVSEHRRKLLAGAHGGILEIGFGTGLNLSHYPSEVEKITTVDPNPGMGCLAERRIKESNIEVDFRQISGEELPFDDNTFDCVVSTFTLCSIPDVNQALNEVFRVLKPGSKFLSLEHGVSPDPGVQKWQRRLNGLEMWLADGCHLDRNIKELISTQPFSSVENDEFYMPKTPKILGYLYRGVARK